MSREFKASNDSRVAGVEGGISGVTTSQQGWCWAQETRLGLCPVDPSSPENHSDFLSISRKALSQSMTEILTDKDAL